MEIVIPQGVEAITALFPGTHEIGMLRLIFSRQDNISFSCRLSRFSGDLCQYVGR